MTRAQWSAEVRRSTKTTGSAKGRIRTSTPSPIPRPRSAPADMARCRAHVPGHRRHCHSSPPQEREAAGPLPARPRCDRNRVPAALPARLGQILAPGRVVGELPFRHRRGIAEIDIGPLPYGIGRKGRAPQQADQFGLLGHNLRQPERLDPRHARWGLQRLFQRLRADRGAPPRASRRSLPPRVQGLALAHSAAARPERSVRCRLDAQRHGDGDDPGRPVGDRRCRSGDDRTEPATPASPTPRCRRCQARSPAWTIAPPSASTGSDTILRSSMSIAGSGTGGIVDGRLGSADVSGAGSIRAGLSFVFSASRC